MAYLSTIFQAVAAQKMKMVFTGDVIATSYHYAMSLLFPRLIMIDPPSVPMEGLLTNTLTFEAEEASAAPTGMTGYTRPGMEFVNLAATDYLA